MGEEHVKMLHDFVNQTAAAKPEGSMSDIVKKMETAVGYMTHLNQGVTMMSTEVAIVRSQLNMLMRMLVETGIFTKEEIDHRYETEVAKPMKEQFEKMKQKMEQQEAIQGAMKNDKKD